MKTTIQVSEVLLAAREAHDFVRQNESMPEVCVGYLWATLAGLVEKCGEPRPNSPWEQS